MFVVHNCTFIAAPVGFVKVLVPGVYSADQFASISNITRNTVLYASNPEHDGSITVTDDGVQTTVTIYPATRRGDPADLLQVICYNDAPGVTPGPAANVAVTNFPASQNINGAVSVNGEVEIKNDTGNPLAVSGSVSVSNLPATQPVSGSVSVSNFPATQPVSGTVTANQGTSPWVTSVNNFPATQAVTGTFFQATQPVSGSVSVSNFPASTTVDGTVDVGNFPATQTVDGSVTINNDSGSPVPVTFPSGVSVSNFPATQTVDGTVDVGNFPATQTVDGSVSVSNFPTSFDVGNFPATQTVDGSVSVSNFPASTTVSGTVDVGNFPTSFDVGNFPTTQTVDGSVSVSNFPTTQPVSGSVSVSGTVDVGNFPATQTVDGSVSVSNFPATQPVSGSVSVSNFPASTTVAGTVDVGNFPATQTVDGSVTVSGTVDVGNFPTSTTVSGTVDVGNFPTSTTVSGTVDVGNFPATTTVDGAVTVSGTVDVNNFPTSTTVSGTVDVGNFPATQTVDGAVTVSGTVDVGNFPATQAVTGTFYQATQPVSGTVDVGNFPASTTVDGTVDIGNYPATQTVDGTVDVGNFPATQTVSGTVDVGNFPATQTVDGSVSVSNFPATQAVTGTFYQATQPVSGSVSVSNFPATQAVTGTFFQATQPVSGTVTANQGTSPWIVSSTGGSTNIASFPTTSTDAFGRLRVSEPFTLFDSSFRYGDNQLWSTATATGGTITYNTFQGLEELNVTTTSGSSVQRQTTKVFSYQPGKSLLIMTTFVCAAPKANLDQKVGYYNTDNGYFLEQDGLTTYFVERSIVSGAVTNTRVAQEDWNVDPMDGTGPSGITLDISKAQILWMDLEWLGVGTVKMGFVINGSFYICHTWNHANIITSTYITTASLPLSCEITNTGTTASASTFKQICATVISEGGYALVGLQQSVGTPVTTPKTLTVAGTFYPLVSIRLKTTRLDAIAVLTALAIQGTGNNNVFRWEVRASGVTTGGSWISAGANSSIEYNLTGTAYTGGRILAAGFTSSSNQGTPSINILKEALFANQLERDIFTATPYELTIVVAGATGGQSCYASMDWEEVSR